jgi:hypothetical protein
VCIDRIDLWNHATAIAKIRILETAFSISTSRLHVHSQTGIHHATHDVRSPCPKHLRCAPPAATKTRQHSSPLTSIPHTQIPRNVQIDAKMMNLAITFLLNLSLFALVEAAPMSVASAKPWQAGTGGGIVGFIVLVLDIIAWSTSRPRHRICGDQMRS